MGQLLKGELLVLGFLFPVFLGVVLFLRAVMLRQKGEEVVSELLLMIAGVFDQLVKLDQVSKRNPDALQEQQQRKHDGKRTRHWIKIVKSL